jgi:tight adherence protein C
MNSVVILVSTSVAILALAGAGTALVFGDRAFQRRLSNRIRRIDPAPTAAVSATIAPALLRAVTTWGERAGRGALEADRRSALRERLVQAGFHAERAAEAFFGIRVVAALGLGGLALLACLAFNVANLLIFAAVVMLAANLGLFLPNLLLSSRIKARAHAVYFGLPDAIDLLVVSLEAGATLSAALQRVEAEFRDLHPVLTEQFAILLAEMQAGASRAEALTRLGRRIASDELRRLATMVIQSEAVGASLGGSLRVFAEEMRQARYLDAERKAAELPVKLAFPLVFCIFPCLSGVIFIPIGLSFLRTVMAP